MRYDFCCNPLQRWMSALSSVGGDGLSVAFAQRERTLHCGRTSNTFPFIYFFSLFLSLSHLQMYILSISVLKKDVDTKSALFTIEQKYF